jgi:predicted nucleic acid-binding protein
MSADGPFFDTNVLVYAFANEGSRTAVAERLLEGGGLVSVHTLNEFVAVAVRKLGMTWEEVAEALRAILLACPSPVPMNLDSHRSALRIARRYGYHIYDSLVIAAALEARCKTLYSEDLRDGQVIEGLAIRNPFAG